MCKRIPNLQSVELLENRHDNNLNFRFEDRFEVDQKHCLQHLNHKQPIQQTTGLERTLTFS